MLQLQLVHLLCLCILLGPGIFAGTIVTWKTRSPWALFITLGSSLVGSFAIALIALIVGKTLAPFLASWLGKWTMLIDFSRTPREYHGEWAGSLAFYLLSYHRYAIIAPTGIVGGAALSGMLLMVRHKLIKSKGKFDQSYAITAGVGGTIIGGVISLPAIIILTWLGSEGIYLVSMYGAGLGLDSSGIIYLAGIAWIFVILLNGLFCGLLSAFGGMKIAKILM